jgi:putative salt-induced outer membrane protein
MTFRPFLIPIVSATVVSAMPTVAADSPPEKRWSDNAELSYVETGGNTQVKTMSLKNLLKARNSEAVTTSWKVAMLRGEDSGVLTAEQYRTEIRVDDQFKERWHGYGTAGWAKDEFAGIESDIYVGPGVGYKFLTGPRHTLVGETGIQYTNEQYTDNTDSRRFDGRLFASYTFAFADKNDFVQTIEFLDDLGELENYRVNTETALVTTLTRQLSFKVSYTIRYNNMPIPDTLDTTDTTLSTALLASF